MFVTLLFTVVQLWSCSDSDPWTAESRVLLPLLSLTAKSLQLCPTLSGLPFPSPMHESEKWKWSRSVVSDSLRPHGLQPTRLLCPWDFPGKSTGVGCHCLLRDCLSEFTQIHAHWVGDAIYAPHPLLPPSTFAFDLSQHQGLFQLVGSLHQVAKVLELQHQSFKWIFRVDFLWDWLVWYPCSPQDFQESSSAPQFESINSLALSFLYGPTLTSIHDYWENHSFD